MVEELEFRFETLEDVEAALTLHRAAVHALGRTYYSQETLDDWAPPVDAERVRSLQERFIPKGTLLAFRAGQLLAFASLQEKGSVLSAFYVHPEAQGKGIGTALLAALEEEARKRGHKELHVESSLNAVPFYEARGFENHGPGIFTRRSGLQMACVHFYKNL